MALVGCGGPNPGEEELSESSLLQPDAGPPGTALSGTGWLSATVVPMQVGPAPKTHASCQGWEVGTEFREACMAGTMRVMKDELTAESFKEKPQCREIPGLQGVYAMCNFRYEVVCEAPFLEKTCADAMWQIHGVHRVHDQDQMALLIDGDRSSLGADSATADAARLRTSGAS